MITACQYCAECILKQRLTFWPWPAYPWNSTYIVLSCDCRLCSMFNALIPLLARMRLMLLWWELLPLTPMRASSVLHGPLAGMNSICVILSPACRTYMEGRQESRDFASSICTCSKLYRTDWSSSSSNCTYLLKSKVIKRDVTVSI